MMNRYNTLFTINHCIAISTTDLRTLKSVKFPCSNDYDILSTVAGHLGKVLTKDMTS